MAPQPIVRARFGILRQSSESKQPRGQEEQHPVIGRSFPSQRFWHAHLDPCQLHAHKKELPIFLLDVVEVIKRHFQEPLQARPLKKL